MKTSMRFDLVDLRLFLFVVEAANITHGAARAGMALASASERIRLMEESLGAPLLERHRRGVRPTPAGAALVHHAQLVIQQVERMRGELSEYADGIRGRVRLFANTTATAEFLPATLAAFLSHHPQIDIDLEEHSSREIVRAVMVRVDGLTKQCDLRDPARHQLPGLAHHVGQATAPLRTPRRRNYAERAPIIAATLHRDERAPAALAQLTRSFCK